MKLKIVFYLISIGIISLVFLKGTFFMGVATISYFTLIFGLINLKNKNLHAKLMSLGICIDLLLVLILEFQRDAINTAVSMSLSPIQQAHIVCSSIATLLYIPVLFLGYMRLTRKWTDPKSRDRHILLGKLAFLFRTLGFILMFSMLQKYSIAG